MLREKYNLGPDMPDDEIRSMRLKIMKEDTHTIENKLSLKWDFFDLNRCKDLLFHPLEHRFTIPGIEKFLNDLNLEYRGIQKPPILRSRYWTFYPDNNDRIELKEWDKFENRYPEAFGNLYEIWALKY
jgi:hypothetical protein